VINVLIVFIGKNYDVVVKSHALSLKVQGLIFFVNFFSWTNEKEDTILDPFPQARKGVAITSRSENLKAPAKLCEENQQKSLWEGFQKFSTFYSL
jgi:hypothetical protein